MTRDILSFANFATVAQSNCVTSMLLPASSRTCRRLHQHYVLQTVRESCLTRVGKKAVNEKKEILPAARREPMKEKCV